MAFTCKSERYWFLGIICMMLLRVAWRSCWWWPTHRRWLAFAGPFFMSRLLGPFAVGCWLHAHSSVVYHPIAVGVAGLLMTGLAAVHPLIPPDQETEAPSQDHALQTQGHDILSSPCKSQTLKEPLLFFNCEL